MKCAFIHQLKIVLEADLLFDWLLCLGWSLDYHCSIQWNRKNLKLQYIPASSLETKKRFENRNILSVIGLTNAKYSLSLIELTINLRRIKTWIVTRLKNIYKLE